MNILVKCDILGCSNNAVYEVVNNYNDSLWELCGKHTENKIKEFSSLEINEIKA